MSRSIARSIVIAGLVAAGFAILNHYAPLQTASVVVDLAIATGFVGAISLIRPVRLVGIRSRRAALGVIAVAVVSAVAALNWPISRSSVVKPTSLLDSFLPSYDVSEKHSVVVHSTPEHAYEAANQVTFTDVKVFAALMQVRLAASGRFRRVRSSPQPILSVMRRPESGFLPLADDGKREMVFGMAGKFWGRGSVVRLATPEEFRTFHDPDSAKTAFNIRIVDMGDGWSQVITETRAVGTDPQGTRILARYWRVIYPGSATIRRMWLDAIKSRAEQQ